MVGVGASRSATAAARLRFVIAVVLYGTIGPITRFISLPSEVIVLFRGAFGSLFVLAFLHARGGALDRQAIRENLRWLVTSGICLGLNWIFLFAAYARTTIAIAGLCNYMAPIIVIALSPVVFGERVGPRRLACVVAAFVGIVLVSDLRGTLAGEVDLTGVALGLMAALAFVGIVICNKRMGVVGAFDKVVVQLGTSAALVAPYALVVNGGGLPLAGVEPRSWLLLALLCLVQTGIRLHLLLRFDGRAACPGDRAAGVPRTGGIGAGLGAGSPRALGLAGAVGAALVITAAAAGELIDE